MSDRAPLYDSPSGEWRLQRYPSRRHERLLAWCAADTLLLQAACAGGLDAADTLVVNDQHGALSIALAPAALWTDSALAAIAMRRNAAVNQRAETPVIWSTEPPLRASLTVMRVPKSLRYFRFQLHQLAQVMRPGDQLLAAGMDKHLAPQTAELIEQYVGPAERHRGASKARLFSAHRAAQQGQLMAPTSYFSDEVDCELSSWPNVFSGDRLDGGSRLLLSVLGSLPPCDLAVDLACGNGILGLALLRRQLATTVVFADESAQAVASARQNHASLEARQQAPAVFFHGDGMPALDAPPELIVCNPPFHLEHAVEAFAGQRLLEQCAASLAHSGKLCVVANRHLPYAESLRRLFAQVEVLTQDRRFVVYLASSD